MEATQARTDEYDAQRWATEAEAALATVANPGLPFARLPLPPEPRDPARELIELARVWTAQVPGLTTPDEATTRLLFDGGSSNFPGLRAAVSRAFHQLAEAIDLRLRRLRLETPREAGLISPSWFPAIGQYLGNPLTVPSVPLMALRWDAIDQLPPGHWLRDSVASLREHDGGLILGPGNRDLLMRITPMPFYTLDLALHLTGEALRRQQQRAERDRQELERQIPRNVAPDPFGKVTRTELEDRLRQLEARLAQLAPGEGKAS